MAPSAAEIEAVDGGGVALSARNRAQHQHLVDGQLAMMPVSSGRAGEPLDIAREQQALRTHEPAQPGEDALQTRQR